VLRNIYAITYGSLFNVLGGLNIGRLEITYRTGGYWNTDANKVESDAYSRGQPNDLGNHTGTSRARVDDRRSASFTEV
jgi:hypothetical protein